MVVGGCRNLVAEHLWLKPEPLGSIPGGTNFLSFPLPFQRSSDSNSPDTLYRSSDLGEPHLSGSLCCDEAQILSKSQTHTATITYQHAMYVYKWCEVCYPQLFKVHTYVALQISANNESLSPLIMHSCTELVSIQSPNSMCTFGFLLLRT